MLRHWTNTLVNRDFPRTVGWDVPNPLTSPVNPVPREVVRESGSVKPVVIECR
jgi:hypothetical protein